MKNVLKVTLLAVCLMIATSPGWCAMSDDGEGTPKFVVRGDLRMRYERLENYFDFDDHGQIDSDLNGTPDSDDAFSFVPYRARVGVMATLPHDAEVVVDIQNFGSWGNEFPAQSFHFPPVQNFDGGGQTNGFRNSETSIYQAYLKLNHVWKDELSFTMGRQEYELGTGLILGNEDYYNGTVFDGIRADWNASHWSATAFAYLNTERNDFASGQFTGFGSDDTTLAGLVGSWALEGGWGSRVEGYGIYYKDGFEGNFKPGWWTFGGHWWRTAATKEDADSNHWDWNLEIAGQTGDITPRLCQGGADDGSICSSDADCAGGTCVDVKDDLGGSIIDASVGYSFTHGNHLLRLSIGGIRQSGDDDLTDDNVDGWNSLYPRNHGRFGNADFFGDNFGGPSLLLPGGILPIANLGGPIDFNTGFVSAVPSSGLTALHAGVNTACNDGKHKWDLTFWWFKPTEDRIDVGAADKVHVKDFGKEVDLGYDYMYSNHITLSAGVSYLKPDSSFGTLLGHIDPSTGDGLDDAVTRVVAQARVKF